MERIDRDRGKKHSKTDGRKETHRKKKKRRNREKETQERDIEEIQNGRNRGEKNDR